jgi:hypothetical protein
MISERQKLLDYIEKNSSVTDTLSPGQLTVLQMASDRGIEWHPEELEFQQERHGTMVGAQIFMSDIANKVLEKLGYEK